MQQVEKNDVKKHLVAAFLSFLEREFESDCDDEQFKELIDAARTSLATAYDLPNDDSLKIPREIEDIFFKEAKHLVKIQKPDDGIKNEVKEENMEMDLGFRRSTDMKTSRRIMFPSGRAVKEEAKIETWMSIWKQVILKYIKVNCRVCSFDPF